MANSVDPDQMPCPVASDLGLHCLFRPVCPNIKVKYVNSSMYKSYKESLKLKMTLIHMLPAKTQIGMRMLYPHAGLPGPEVIKPFPCSAQMRMKFSC